MELFSVDSLLQLLISKHKLSSLTMTILVISHLAQPILELLLEHPFILNFQILPRKKTKSNSTRSLINTTFKSEVSMESIPKLTMAFSISQTEEDSEEVKPIWFKTCTMESKV